MLTEIYIEALLVDEELADKVWEAWDKGEVDDLNVRFREKQTFTTPSQFLHISPNFSG